VRFLILDTDYPEFLRSLYNEHPGLEEQSYERQTEVRANSFFGIAGFYAANLRKLNHEAMPIYANNEWAQKAWAAEHGLARARDQSWQFRWRRKVIPWLSRVPAPGWTEKLLAAQIEHYRPDVLLNQAMDSISSRFLKKIKNHVRLLVGQIAAPVPKDEEWGVYDLVVSSLPNLVEYFHSCTIPAEFSRLGFEPSVLDNLATQGRDIPVSFVGSFFPQHEERTKLLEHLCSELPMKVWGHGIDLLPKSSPIHDHYMGKAWGLGMYEVLRRSRITVNHHINIAGSYANNLRLFEATGVGALLVTDWKENLQEMFEPRKEVIAYRNADGCVELIRDYLEHDSEREAIAARGQERTLREHTYQQRAQQLVDIIQKYM
jgi:spore maturation protein CgeB